MESLVDSEVALMIPTLTKESFDLYTVHRKTNYTSLQLDHIGEFDDDIEGFDYFGVPTTLRRKDFQGAVIRAAAAVRKWTSYLLSYLQKERKVERIYFIVG